MQSPRTQGDVQSCLSAELLDVYRQDIVALQSRCASAASAPPLASIRHHLAPWQVAHAQLLLQQTIRRACFASAGHYS